MTLAVDDDANAAAVWLRGEGGGSVLAALSRAGEDWSAPAELSPEVPVSEASGASVDAVMDLRGTVIAVWGRERQDRGETENVIQAAIHGPP